MVTESIIRAVFHIFPSLFQSSLAFWATITIITASLIYYRQKPKTYLASTLFFFSMCFINCSIIFCQNTIPNSNLAQILCQISLILLLVSRFLFIKANQDLCIITIPKFLFTGTWISSSIFALSILIDIFIPLDLSIYIERTMSIFLAIHSVLCVIFIFLAAKQQVNAKVIGIGSVLWALAWLGIASFTVLDILNISISPWLLPYILIFLVFSEFIAGLSIINSAMIELTIMPSTELPLDDYLNKLTESARRFIPDEFLNQLQKTNFINLELGDHVKKEMTIFFSDVRSFTELSEQLSPEEGFAFINSYLSRVVPIISEHSGFVDKYMGDGIMAIFPESEGADQAVETAVAMQEKIKEYNVHRSNVGYRSISVGIGIHTGPIMLGVVGVNNRMEGTAISDSVNLSSRLQSIAKAFNVPIVISESTFMQLLDPGKYKFRFIGKVRVKGKDQPVSVFEIFNGLPDDILDAKMKSNTYFEQGMLCYYQKDYSQAASYFTRVLDFVPEDGASKFYLETCLRKTVTWKILNKKKE